jgi:hypothetical protein
MYWDIRYINITLFSSWKEKKKNARKIEINLFERLQKKEKKKMDRPPITCHEHVFLAYKEEEEDKNVWRKKGNLDEKGMNIE